MNLSFREKSTWVSLIIVTVVWLNYFIRIRPALFDGSIGRLESIGLFVGAVVVLVVMQIIGQIIAVSTSRSADQSADERDKSIASKAGNISGWVLSFLVVTVGGYALFIDVSSVVIANWLLLSLVLSQIAEYALTLFYYRRGW